MFHFTKVECKQNVGPFLEQFCKSTPRPSTIVQSFVKLQKISCLLLIQFKGLGLRQFLHVNTSRACSVFGFGLCILYTGYAVSIHLSLFFESEIVRADEGLLVLSACWGHLVEMDSEGPKPCRKIITFFDSNTSPNLC